MLVGLLLIVSGVIMLIQLVLVLRLWQQTRRLMAEGAERCIHCAKVANKSFAEQIVENIKYTALECEKCGDVDRVGVNKYGFVEGGVCCHCGGEMFKTAYLFESDTEGKDNEN